MPAPVPQPAPVQAPPVIVPESVPVPPPAPVQAVIPEPVAEVPQQEVYQAPAEVPQSVAPMSFDSPPAAPMSFDTPAPVSLEDTIAVTVEATEQQDEPLPLWQPQALPGPVPPPRPTGMLKIQASSSTMPNILPSDPHKIGRGSNETDKRLRGMQNEDKFADW
jgi:hypothetical protein